jgi:hypothetical protein
LIILYHHGAASDKSRYFCAELGHHVKEECKNNGKLIITVLFPPTTPKNLPTYLTARHIIETTTDGIDHGSIERVIGGVQRWEAERQKTERQEAERRKAETRRDIQNKDTSVFSLLIAAIVMLTVIVIYIQSKPPHDSPDTGTESPSSDPWAVSKKTCEELLLGKQYDVWGGYTLIEQDHIKATSEAGTWKLKSCEKNWAPAGTYILHGEEKTEQKVEVEINGKYHHVAQAENESRSILIIGKDGGLVDRKIDYEHEGRFNGIPKIDHVGRTEQVWKKHEGDILKALDKYKEHLAALHIKASKNMHCIPTRGKREDNREVIAFTCVIDPSASDWPKYTRVMVKGIDRS